MTDRVEEVAEELVGTCESLRDVVTDAECDDAEFLQALEELVFCCEACGWWHLVEELHNEGSEDLCPDCDEETEVRE